MIYTWDEKKNQSNIKKHKVSFVQAVHAFQDPLRMDFFDQRHSSLDEDRYLLFGFAGSSVLIISYAEPDAQTTRILSARKAKKYELEAVKYGKS